MFLALSAIRHGPEQFAIPVTTPLTAARYTIGRGEDCDIVLVDLTRHISRLHATISQRGGAYLLTVNSRVNPVVINGTAVAVGQSAALSVGDQVTIGDYLFDVVAHDETMKAATRSEADPLAAPLGGLATGPSTLDALFGPNTVKLPTEPPSARSNLDDLIGGHRPASDDPLLHVLGGGTPAARPDAGNGLASAHNQNDPLMQLLGHGTSSGPSGIVPNDSPAFPLDVGRGVASIDDILGGGPAPAADPLGLGISDNRGRADAFGGGRGGSLELDHVHDVNLPMSFPQARAREQAPPPVVPPIQRARPGPPQQIESPPPPRVVPPTADDPLAALLDGKQRDAAAPSSRNRKDPLGLLPEPGSASSAPAARSLDVERPTRRPYAPQPDAEAPASPRNAPEAARAPTLTAPIVQAFLEGAGMAGVKIRDDEAEAFIRECGEVCRTAIEGLMGLLLARATVKEELRANDRTMVAARENNPLKLVESVDEAIRFVLDPSTRTDAFLPPSKAVADACSDLRSHEIALVVGMRSALVGAIRRFDPVKLEKLLQKQGGVSLLANRKAKLWDCFLDHYDKTNRDAEDNFDKVFGADFLRAYQEQVKRLRKG